MIKATYIEAIANLFDGQKLWLVPTFQRPYAWGAQVEAKQLFDDVTQSSVRKGGDYYISPIHVIEVTKDEIGKGLLDDYVDASLNLPKTKLVDNNAAQTIIHETSYDFTTYLVIDGQQRLLTSYIALLVAGRLRVADRIVIGGGGPQIPLVVPGSKAELSELWSQITNGKSVGGQSRAARKIADLFEVMRNGNPLAGQLAHDFANKVKLLRVVLDPHAAVGSFLTLNDRGKPLTTLEKFKAHTLYLFDITPVKPAGMNPQVLHHSFGDVYRSLDQLGSILNDDTVVQILGCSNIVGQPAEAVAWASKKWYDSYIAVKTSVPVDWPTRLTAIARFNDNLVNLRTPPSGSPPTQGNGRTVSQDIEFVFDRFMPNHRVLTIVHLLLDKFSPSLFGPCGSINLDNSQLLSGLNARVANLNGQVPNLTAASQTIFSGWISQLSTNLGGVAKQEVRAVSLLQLARMLNLTSVKPAQYQTCIAGIQASTILADALSWVEHYLAVNRGRKYILDFLEPGDTARDTPAYMLVLDFEAQKGRHWAMRPADDQVEHIFARQGYRSLHSPSAYGFQSESEYDDLVAKVGNIFPLDSRLNVSINNFPLITKANHYVTQQLVNGSMVVPGNQTPQTYSPSAVDLGKRIGQLGSDYMAHRLLVELRTVELGVFALKNL